MMQMRWQTPPCSLAMGLVRGLVLLGRAVCVCLLLSTTPVGAQNLLWTTKAPMPTPRTEFGVAVAQNKLYAIGGFSGTTLALVDEYDPATDTWTPKAPLPTPRRLLVVTAVQDKIYAIGGMSFTDPNSVTYSTATEEYDPLTNRWTRKADFPLPPVPNSVLGNLFIGGEAVNGKIYVVVFSVTLPGATATYVYDPLTDRWDTRKAPVPFAYTRYAAASANGKLYVLATQQGPAETIPPAPLAAYDPSTDLWIIQPALTMRRRLLALAATPQRLYTIGGQELAPPFAVVTTIEDFDLATQTWVATTPMPTGRHSAGVATLAGTLYVLGGSDAAGVPLAVVEAGRVQGSPSPPTLTIALTGCTRCKAGDTFSVNATVTNPATHVVRVEVKAGVVFPDGAEFNAWRLRDKHFTAELAPGLDVTVEFLREQIPAGLPSGLWYYEGALLSPELGRTLARDTQAFTLE